MNTDTKETITGMKLIPLLSGDELPINSLTKAKFLQQISTNLEKYSDIKFTPEEMRDISDQLRQLAHGSQAAAPMLCAAELCPLADRCIFQQMGRAPRGRSCLYEEQLLQYWRIRYIEDYNVDPNDFTEVGMVSELAEIELYLWRLNLQLGRPGEAMLVTDQLVGITPAGKKIYEKKLSPFFEAKEKLLTRKSKLVKLLVGDRQEKYKKQAALRTREDTDPASLNVEMRKMLEGLVLKYKELQTSSSTVVDSTKDDGYVAFIPKKV